MLNERMILNDEFGRMRNEADMAYFKVGHYLSICME
jgi:hypothetical protein